MGRISHIFLMQYLKWGTTFEYEFDLEEEVDKDDL
jgi:hypothetical protein